VKEQNPVIEEIRQKADIVSIVSDYVALKKRGRNYLGLCPFHSEKTASFTVSQEKQLFHCFGCGEGGNVFSFIMKMENIGFWESVKILADKLSIPFDSSSYQPGEDMQQKNLALEINSSAADFFSSQLPGSAVATEYIKKRGLGEKVVSFFKIGYSPESWDKLYKHLVSKGFMPKDIEKAGLIVQKAGDTVSYYDRFRNRLMIPIFDIKGRIVGFGARSLDGSEPKYLNSPDSPVYSKGNILYGLNFSKEEIKTKDSVLIVEGYMDFISCFSNGIKNVAASSGTALTMNHAKTLQRFTSNFMLVFDSDAAGSLATERSIELLKELGIYPKIVPVIGGKDPDELIRKEGPQKFLDLVKEAVPWLKYKLEAAISRHNTKEAEGKSKALRQSAAILSTEQDQIIRREYAKFISQKLGVDLDAIESEIRRRSYYSRSAGKIDQPKKPLSKDKIAEKVLIKFAAEDNKALELIRSQVETGDFSDEQCKTIFDVVALKAEGSGPAEAAKIVESLDGETKKAFSEIMLMEFEFDDKDKALNDCINVLRLGKMKKRLAALRHEISEAETKNDYPRITALQEEYKKCHSEMRSMQ